MRLVLNVGKYLKKEIYGNNKDFKEQKGIVYPDMDYLEYNVFFYVKM